MNILGAILYIFPTHGTEVLSSVHSATGPEMGVQYSQKGYRTNRTHCLFFGAMTSAHSQEMTSHMPYIFELRLLKVYGFRFIAVLDQRPSIVY